MVIKILLGIMFPPYGIYLIIRYLLRGFFSNLFTSTIEKYEYCPKCNERNGIDDIIDTNTISSKYEHERVNGRKDERYTKNDLVDKTEYTYKCKKCGNEFKSVRDEKRGSTDSIVGQFVDLGIESQKTGESIREYERKYPERQIPNFTGNGINYGISIEERLSLLRPKWEEDYLNLQSENDKLKNDLDYLIKINHQIGVKKKYEFELEGDWYSVSRLEDLRDGTFPNSQNESLIRKSYENRYKGDLEKLNDYFKQEYSIKYYEVELERFKIFVEGLKKTFGENYLKSLIHECWLGMTEKELLKVKGVPDHKIEKVSRGKTREEFFYDGYKNRQGNMSYKFRVILIDGKVDGWNDITN